MSKGETIERTELDNYKVRLSWVDDVISPLDDHDRAVHKYTISIKPLENPDKVKRFDFYGSLANYMSGDHPEALEALWAVFMDASSYCRNQDIDDFHESLGYDDVSKSLEAFESCKSTAKDLKAIGLDQDKINNLLNTELSGY